MLNDTISGNDQLGAIEIKKAGVSHVSESAVQVPAPVPTKLKCNPKNFLKAINNNRLASQLLAMSRQHQQCRRVVAYEILQSMLQRKWLDWGDNLIPQIKYAEKQLRELVYHFHREFNPPALLDEADVEHSTKYHESTTFDGLPTLVSVAEIAAEANEKMAAQERALRAHWQHLLATSLDEPLRKNIQKAQQTLQNARDRYDTFVVLQQWRQLQAAERAIVADITQAWGGQVLPDGEVLQRLWQKASPPFINTRHPQETNEQEQKYNDYDRYQRVRRQRTQMEMHLALLCRADAHYQDFYQHIVAQYGVSWGAHKGDFNSLNALAEALSTAIQN